MYVANNPAQLSGIFSKIGKAVKKVAKVAVKLSPSHAVISKIKPLKKISPAFRVAEAKTPLIAATSAPKSPPVIEAPTVPAIVTPPEPVSAPPVTAAPAPAVAPPAPSPAPPPAAESFAMPLAPAPSMFGPSFAPSAVPDSAPPAAPASDSKLPLILGAAGLGLAALLFMKKKG